MTQTSRPASDRSNPGNWRRHDGQTSGLWTAVGEDVPDMGTYIVAPRPGASPWKFHRPVRPFPGFPSRVVDESSPELYIAPWGSDTAGDGSFSAPYFSLQKAASMLPAGGTVYARGKLPTASWEDETGVYAYANLTQVQRKFLKDGALGAPVVLRGYPGELPIFEVGWEPFWKDPDLAWEPVPATFGGLPTGAIEGEYWSTQTYDHDNEAKAIGLVIESLTPLVRYPRLKDLRSDNQFQIIDTDPASDTFGESIFQNGRNGPTYGGVATDTGPGLYWGPGIHYNKDSAHPGYLRYHVRLAPTNIEALRVENYLRFGDADFDNNFHGEQDPRNLAISVTPNNRIVSLGGNHAKFRDLAFRGHHKLELGDVTSSAQVGLEFDNLDVSFGLYGISVQLGGNDPVLSNSRFRGYSAPWSSRFHDKQRVSQQTILELRARNPVLDRVWFTEGHNAVTMNDTLLESLSVRRCAFWNNNDDNLFLPRRHATRVVHVEQCWFAGNTLTLSHQSGIGDVAPADIGDYVRRNFIEIDVPVYSGPPESNDQLDVFRYSTLWGSHGGTGAWPHAFSYHNTILIHDANQQSYYLVGHGGCNWAENDVNAWNNLVIQVLGNVNNNICSRAGDVVSFNNRRWAISGTNASTRPGDTHGDPQLKAYSTDYKVARDIRPAVGSPLLGAGAEIPSTWPDSLRNAGTENPAAPTVGAAPAGIADGEILFGPEATV